MMQRIQDFQSIWKSGHFFIYGNPYTTRVQVYAATQPLFFNSLCLPEFRLFSLATTSARRLEEAAVVRFFIPLINI